MRKLYFYFTLLCIFFTGGMYAQSFDKAVISNVSVINSSKLDFAPAFHKDGIVFVSNNQDIVSKNKIFDKHINQKTMSLLISKKDNNGILQKPEPFAMELVTTVHEGPLTFSKDFKTVYFSRNNNKKAGKAKYVELIDRMQIYKSEHSDKGWSKPARVEFDRETKDYCHPTLSADGKWIYFSSNRKGGYGGMDLYRSEILPNGKVGKPLNLGATINSEKNEVFPFLHDDGTLFFSSNKLGGTGGLDIYHVRQKQGSEEFGHPISIGAPFNSEKDDFGFILNNARKLGYFSSNRAGGFGEDDIYSFIMDEQLQPTQEEALPLLVTVIDRQTQVIIPNAEVTLLLQNSFENTVQKYTTNDKGQVVLTRKRLSDYEVKINKETYDTEHFGLQKTDMRPEIIVLMDKPKDDNLTEVTIQVLDRDTRQPISLANVHWRTHGNMLTEADGTSILHINKGDNHNIDILKADYFTEKITYTKEDTRTKVVVLMRQSKAIATTENVTNPVINANPASILVERPVTSTANTEFLYMNKIYYDFDKAHIRKDASHTLDSVIMMLNQYPDMMIEVEAHTDSRGANRYNDNLSERRAINATQYLIKHGVSRHRIKRVSRGELVLTNDCDDNVPCSETDHQANRRAEIRIVKYGSAEGKVMSR
jgi:outer membrane protein OmpA-like peptidoglycan-associated protein